MMSRNENGGRHQEEGFCDSLNQSSVAESQVVILELLIRAAGRLVMGFFRFPPPNRGTTKTGAAVADAP
jgi:hypothetical protein